MNLDDAQKQRVAAWIGEGLKLSEIQKRIESELGLRLTYMEVRFLLDDLKIMPKDPTPPPAPAASPASALNGGQPVPPGLPPGAGPAVDLEPEVLPAGPAKVKLTVDQIARPGTVISGTVVFSDGQGGNWHLDQAGRLGLGAKQKGYRPSAPDLEEFQLLLQRELARLGY